MSDNNLELIRHNVLKSIRQHFVDELVYAEVEKKDEYGVEVLTVELEDSDVDGYDARGEFFFMPAAEDEIQYFENLITIADELHKETASELFVAVSAISLYIPAGTFAIDFVTGSLIYKHTYEMHAGLDEQEIQENAELSVRTALSVVGEYGYLLAEVNDGKRSAESVIRLFTPLE
jgi:hypothetical protein